MTYVYFIVEFPAILMDVNTGDIVSEFQQYVQPQEHPILSSFCTKLTGISQVGSLALYKNDHTSIVSGG